MILADTSIWVDHLRYERGSLAPLLSEGRVLGHPFVLGELLCGNLGAGKEKFQLLTELPQAPMATDDEVVGLIRFRRLMGRGIGYLDAHLVASALLGDGVRLWTTDGRLAAVATELGVVYTP